MGRRVVDGQPPGLREGHDEDRAEGEQVARAQGRSGVGHGARHDLAEVGGTGAEGQGEDGERDGGLRERGHRHLAAGPHPPEGRARVEARQGEEEGPEQQEVHHHQQVSYSVEG